MPAAPAAAVDDAQRARMQRRRALIAVLLALFNLPWMALWWRFTDPLQPRGAGITALYMILAICTAGMIALPFVLGEFARRRWLLILILSLVNLYWCLRWIDLFAQTQPLDAAYAAARHSLVRLMLVSSLLVILLYQLADSLLRPRRPAPPA